MAAMAFDAGGGSPLGVDGGGKDLRRAPIMKNRVPMPHAEMKSDSLRPRDSTRKNTKIEVATTFTIP